MGHETSAAYSYSFGLMLVCYFRYRGNQPLAALGAQDLAMVRELVRAAFG